MLTVIGELVIDACVCVCDLFDARALTLKGSVCATISVSVCVHASVVTLTHSLRQKYLLTLKLADKPH